MSESIITTKLSLRRSLPAMPEPVKFDEECGEPYRWGFNGNISQSARWVTDGHILLAVDAIDPAVVIERDECSYARKYPTEETIREVWDPVLTRSDVAAGFLGVCVQDEASSYELAFLRDTQGRVVVVDAWLLAFCVAAVHPDALTVSEAPWASWRDGGRVCDTPVALRRGGQLVGLLMPMRMSLDEFCQYDLEGELVSLAQAVLA